MTLLRCVVALVAVGIARDLDMSAEPTAKAIILAAIVISFAMPTEVRR